MKSLRILPKSLMHRSFRKVAARMLRGLSSGAAVEVNGRPPVARVTESAITLLEPPGSVCVMYAAALEELGEAYANQRPAVSHTLCISRGDGVCEWTLESL